jgi:hypothetical protein
MCPADVLAAGWAVPSSALRFFADLTNGMNYTKRERERESELANARQCMQEEHGMNTNQQSICTSCSIALTLYSVLPLLDMLLASGSVADKRYQSEEADQL